MSVERIDNLYVAAYLLAAGHPLSHLAPDPAVPQRFVFFFAGGARLTKDLQAFFARETLINAYAFVERVRELKMLVLAGRRALRHE